MVGALSLTMWICCFARSLAFYLGYTATQSCIKLGCDHYVRIIMCKLYQVGVWSPPHKEMKIITLYSFFFWSGLHDLMPSYNALPSNGRIRFLYLVEVWMVQTSWNWKRSGSGSKFKISFFWPTNDGHKPGWLIFRLRGLLDFVCHPL